MLHPLEVLGVGDQPLVHPAAVPLAAGLDLLDVGVGLLLVGGQVVDEDLGVAGLFLQIEAGLGQLGDLRVGGEACELVLKLVDPGVVLLYVEQLELGERVGFQRRLPL
nr:hypothetical protein [Nocardioides speluncae]